MPKALPATVDDYIAEFPAEVQARLRQIRGIIRRAAPRAIETISYRIPAYRQDGPLVYFAGYKTHIGVYPLSAGIRKVLKERLAGYDSPTASATARFPHDRPLPRTLIARIVRLRAQENRTRAAARPSSGARTATGTRKKRP